ncbi:hypothetical protein CBR_g66667 [Chara braunii]|uniref:Autophagy-related protein 13 N-terminal domain-containing protein n=1 Tax=Chara braunii TaxID=69332 RepID=A0A388JPZ5_CHABU|nr:hypothetical protein CBR_g66667 [Chara braunii]|eukprot:GBG59860.1 hypothetical protein CBR_g66667 [Chara braunii]
MAGHGEGSGAMDQIVTEFFSRVLHVIIDARIGSISRLSNAPSHQRAGAVAEAAGSSLGAAAAAAKHAANSWFNIQLDPSEVVRREADPWRRSQLEPMIIDIFLEHRSSAAMDVSSSFIGSGVDWGGGGYGDRRASFGREDHRGSRGGGGRIGSTLLERWVVQCERKRREGGPGASGGRGGEVSGGGGRGGITLTPRGGGVLTASAYNAATRVGTSGGGGGGGSVLGGGGSSSSGVVPPHVMEIPVVYKRAVIMLRSLFCLVRTLPAHRLVRLARSHAHHPGGLSLTYRVRSSAPPIPEADASDMEVHKLSPVDTPVGRLCLSVSYRHSAGVTALEVAPTILPCIIPDYVGSPSASNCSPPSNGPASGGRVGVLSSPYPSPDGSVSRGEGGGAGAQQQPSGRRLSKPRLPTFRPPGDVGSPSSPSHGNYSFTGKPPSPSRSSSQDGTSPSGHGQIVSPRGSGGWPGSSPSSQAGSPAEGSVGGGERGGGGFGRGPRSSTAPMSIPRSSGRRAGEVVFRRSLSTGDPSSTAMGTGVGSPRLSVPGTGGQGAPVGSSSSGGNDSPGSGRGGRGEEGGGGTGGGGPAGRRYSRGVSAHSPPTSSFRPSSAPATVDHHNWDNPASSANGTPVHPPIIGIGGIGGGGVGPSTSVSGSEGSVTTGLSVSPTLPFASTPVKQTPLRLMEFDDNQGVGCMGGGTSPGTETAAPRAGGGGGGGVEGGGGGPLTSRSTPRTTGKEPSSIARTHGSNFSLSMEAKAMARLSISPLSDNPPIVSPTHPLGGGALQRKHHRDEKATACRNGSFATIQFVSNRGFILTNKKDEYNKEGVLVNVIIRFSLYC